MIELPDDMKAVVELTSQLATAGLTLTVSGDDLRALLLAYQERGRALKDLLDHVDAETCVHENTHRGGTLWTICDDCGRKWADDEGGFVPYKDAPAVPKPRATLIRKSHD
jgi:hypothetical protein